MVGPNAAGVWMSSLVVIWCRPLLVRLRTQLKAGLDYQNTEVAKDLWCVCRWLLATWQLNVGKPHNGIHVRLWEHPLQVVSRRHTAQTVIFCDTVIGYMQDGRCSPMHSTNQRDKYVPHSPMNAMVRYLSRIVSGQRCGGALRKRAFLVFRVMNVINRDFNQRQPRWAGPHWLRCP